VDAQHLGVSATTRWPAGDLRRTSLTCHPRIEHGSRRVCTTGRGSASQGYLDVDQPSWDPNSGTFAENHPLPPFAGSGMVDELRLDGLRRRSINRDNGLQ
jgi:hypothetical protein